MSLLRRLNTNTTCTKDPLILEGKSTSSPTKTQNVGVKSSKPSLDGKVEYLDQNGIPRRSENITHRMLQRGHSIEKAMVLDELEQAHTSVPARTKDTQTRQVALSAEMEEFETKQRANAEFKRLNQESRAQWLKEGNELIVARLEMMYDNNMIGKDKNVVDITEANAAQSPSKTMTFIDSDGNLRRKSNGTSPKKLDHTECSV